MRASRWSAPRSSYHPRMTKIVSFVSAVLAVVFYGLWSYGMPGRFDAYAGFAGAIFVLTTAVEFRKVTLTPHDHRLFAEFKSLFADRYLIPIYQSHDFLLPFRKTAVDPLYTVDAIWSDAAHSFNNKALERKRVAFVRAASELAQEIARGTIPKGAYVTVIPREMDPENLAEWVKQDAQAINAKLPAFIQAHEELLRSGTKRGAGGSPFAAAVTASPKYTPEPDTPRTPESVFAYLQGNARLLDLTEQLITRRKLDKRKVTSGIAWLDERLDVLGVKTIRELDRFVEQYGEAAGRLSNYFSPQGPIDSSFLLGYVLDIVVIEQAGLEGLRTHNELLRKSSGHDADYNFRAYRESSPVAHS